MFRSISRSVILRRNIRFLSTQQRTPKNQQTHQKFQRSSADRQPKIVVAALGLGIASAFLSTVAYYEATRPKCEGMDSVLTHEEPITHTKFPLTLTGYSTPDSTHWLATASVRCMMNLCALERARAYSYAIYITPQSAEQLGGSKNINEAVDVLLPKRAIEANLTPPSDEMPHFIPAAKFEGAKQGYVFKMGIPADGLDKEPRLGYHKDLTSIIRNVAESEHFYESMILRMHFLHNAGGEHLAHGFDRTLLKRIRSVQGRAGDGKEALRKLNRLITSRKTWEKGTILEFIRLPGGVVEFKVDGSTAIRVHSETFSWALFDAYIGEKGHLNSSCKQELLDRAREINTIMNE